MASARDARVPRWRCDRPPGHSTPHRRPGLKGHWRISSLLAVAALFYLVYPSRVPECDAVIYASAALRGIREITFDPGHLGFGSLEALAAAAGRTVQPPLNPVLILQYVSMAAALAAAYAFYRTLGDL